MTDEPVWIGPEQFREHLVPIDSLEPWPGNPRQGDVGAMSVSLERFGQYRLAVVQEGSGRIAAGNHMWVAAKALGWTHLAVLVRPMGDVEARNLLLADNRVADRGSYDQDALADLLRELAAEDNLDPASGYDLDDLDDLLADLDRVNPLPPAEPRTEPERTSTGAAHEPPQPGLRELRVMVPSDAWDALQADLERVREHHDLPTTAAALVRAVGEYAGGLGT